MILIGSTYFFQEIEGFVSKDIDHIELVDNPKDFKNCWQMTGRGRCLFKWRRMPPDEFIAVSLEYKLPMAIGKFLVPEFNNEIGFTINHLKKLQPLVDNLDDRHKYEKVIYDSYIANNDFILTDDQLNEAYKEYLKYRT
jgi:hypothetical protein